MPAALAHVMVVGGTRAEWAALDPARWDELVDALGTVAADAGARWLTVRPYQDAVEVGGGGTRTRLRWERTVADGRCVAIVDDEADGRQHFADAVASIGPDTPPDEKAVTRVLYAPADVEPDLVLVLGDSTRLPPSLLWELAYGELVFRGERFDQLTGADLAAAIDEFRRRQRRFGGLDG